MDFIDLPGGAAEYRYRAWPGLGRHRPIAGTYVIVSGVGPAAEVRVIGATTDLSALDKTASRLEPDEKLFTRLGVSRSERETTQADLAAKSPTAQTEVDKV